MSGIEPKISLHYDNLEDAKSAIQSKELATLLTDIQDWLTRPTTFCGSREWIQEMLLKKAKRRNLEHLLKPKPEHTDNT